MIVNALVEKLKRWAKDDFKGRHFEATLILQAVSWHLRYPLSYRDIEELFRERGLEVGPVAKFWRLRLVEPAGGIGASEPEVAYDPERDCREAEAPLQG